MLSRRGFLGRALGAAVAAAATALGLGTLAIRRELPAVRVVPELGESLDDLIYNISPTDTPFMEMIGRGSFGPTHAWVGDELKPRRP